MYLSEYPTLFLSDLPKLFTNRETAKRWWEDCDFNLGQFGDCLFWQLSKPDLNLFMNGFKGEGEVAEVGVFRGSFALCMAKYFHDRTVHLFDTFEGIPESEICDYDLINASACHEAGDFEGTSLEVVQRLLLGHDCYNAVFHKGRFPNTAEEVKDKRFCFVSIDVDLYKPTKAAWEFFYPRMVKGGVIAVYDDYNFSSCPGATKATDEFLQDKPELLHFELVKDKALKNLVYIVKEKDD